jgi:glycosyltransferase involved in cell wall biosynthesis
MPRVDSEAIEQEAGDYKLCDRILVPSHFVKRSFIDQGFDEDKIIVVPFGVDLTMFKRQKKKDKKFRVIWCGTICIRKGLHYLLQAFHELNLPDSELVLLGTISDEMTPFIEKYKSPNIIFAGPKPQAQLHKHYSQGSVFVHPSIEEGLSLVQLEAMACGLPLICTTNTGGEEIIREGKEGFIVPIRDVKALKDRMKILYDNPRKQASMADAAALRAKRFTWNDYGDKLYRELKRVVKAHKSIKILKRTAIRPQTR